MPNRMQLICSSRNKLAHIQIWNFKGDSKYLREKDEQVLKTDSKVKCPLLCLEFYSDNGDPLRTQAIFLQATLPLKCVQCKEHFREEGLISTEGDKGQNMTINHCACKYSMLIARIYVPNHPIDTIRQILTIDFISLYSLLACITSSKWAHTIMNYLLSLSLPASLLLSVGCSLEYSFQDRDRKFCG